MDNKLGSDEGEGLVSTEDEELRGKETVKQGSGGTSCWAVEDLE